MMAAYDRHFMAEMKKELDVELLGVASVGKSGSKELKDRARALLPGAKSVVVFGKEIFKEVVSLLGPSKQVGEGAGGDFFGPHSDYLNGRLTRAVYDLAGLLRKEGYRSFPLPAAGSPVDQRNLVALFSYKHAAALAGLGKMGRHTMLMTQEFGPRVRLACLLIDAEMESSPVSKKNPCLQCNACIRACPSKALQVPEKGKAYSMNPFACRTYRNTGLTCTVCMKACVQALG